MTELPGLCPDLAAWECLAAGDAAPPEAEGLRRHLRACGACRALHEALQRNDDFLGTIRVALEGWRAKAPAAFVGTTLGRYRIVGLLGVGGMASVYEAVQDRPARTVALKVIQGGMVTPAALRRFELEAELLGRLQHPGIARVHDAGTVEGSLGRIAYIAMERVQGQRLTEYAAGLGVPERLRLLALVCDAVEHAHQRSVIHRDLKPGNILVDEHGQPKVLDFGIARVLDADVYTTTRRTEAGDLVGTVAYMSPEQAAGDAGEVDTRSDVYSLGVVGYELLTGRLPYAVRDAGLVEAVRLIRECDPAPMSANSSPHTPVPRDAQTVIGKALAKDPAARYSSAGALAADIRRFLADEPIAARAPTAAYRLARFARRHRLLVGSAGVVLAAMIIGLAGLAFGLAQARAERDAARLSERRAEERRATAEAAVTMLQSMLAAANPHEVRGHGYTVRQLLDDAARDMHLALAGQPEVEAAVRSTIGNAYRLLGAYAPARAHLERAMELRRATAGADAPLALASRRDLAWLLHDEARYDQAVAMLREVLAAQRAALGSEHEEVASTLHALSDALRHAADFEQSRALGLEALEMRRRLLGPRHPETGEALGNLSKLARDRGDYADAEVLVRQAIDIWTQTYPSGHPRLIDAGNDLGWLRYLARDFAEAESLLRRTLESGERLLGASHPDVGTTRYELGMVLYARGALPEAESLLRGALATFAAAHGEDHPAVSTSLTGLSNVLRGLKDFEEAEAVTRRALGIAGRVLGEGSTDYALALENLAMVLRLRGELEQAEACYVRALGIHRANYAAPHPHVAEALHRLGLVRQARGDLAGAERTLREAAEAAAAAQGDDHPDTLWVSHSLAALYIELERFSEAEPILQGITAAGRLHASAWRQGEALLTLARCLHRMNRLDAAEPAAREAVDVLTAVLGPEHTRTRAALSQLADLCAAGGNAAEAQAIRHRLEPPPSR